MSLPKRASSGPLPAIVDHDAPPASPGASVLANPSNILPAKPPLLADATSPFTQKRRRTQSGINVFTDEPNPIISNNTLFPDSHTGWQATVENAVKSIVSIRFAQVSAFDTEGPVCSEASGFIVDAERGIILTNR